VPSGAFFFGGGGYWCFDSRSNNRRHPSLTTIVTLFVVDHTVRVLSLHCFGVEAFTTTKQTNQDLPALFIVP
jgi:hypothetical protein